MGRHESGIPAALRAKSGVTDTLLGASGHERSFCATSHGDGGRGLQPNRPFVPGQAKLLPALVRRAPPSGARRYRVASIFLVLIAAECRPDRGEDAVVKKLCLTHARDGFYDIPRGVVGYSPVGAGLEVSDALDRG